MLGDRAHAVRSAQMFREFHLTDAALPREPGSSADLAAREGGSFRGGHPASRRPGRQGGAAADASHGRLVKLVPDERVAGVLA
jgi:hypothetical protein